MKTVSKDELTAMNGHMVRCARELNDARMDVIASACLVAIMCQGNSYHRETERSLRQVCNEHGTETLIVTSAGALIEASKALGAKKLAIITPYMKALTDLVISYIEGEGIEVLDAISLEIPDNLEVVPLATPWALVELCQKTLDAKCGCRGVVGLCTDALSCRTGYRATDLRCAGLFYRSGHSIRRYCVR